ncbi:hypothetical protein HAX54_033009, partial [Datura stramonium]|nr:hypothetical protein [Datura stramonium]
HRINHNYTTSSMAHSPSCAARGATRSQCSATKGETPCSFLRDAKRGAPNLSSGQQAHLVDRVIDEYKEGLENLLFDLDLMYMLRCLRMKEDWGYGRFERISEDPPKYESQDLSENGFLFKECITAWISSH